jgi:hypothetical protein
MNSLSLFYTTQITCMHSSYTPPLCHAMSYVHPLKATELPYFNCTSTKLNILSIRNICCSTNKQSNNTILSLPVPSQCQGHFKQNEEFKTNYFNGSEALSSTFHSQLKKSFLFHFSFFLLTYCFHFRITWGSLALIRGLEMQDLRSSCVKLQQVKFIL